MLHCYNLFIRIYYFNYIYSSPDKKSTLHSPLWKHENLKTQIIPFNSISLILYLTNIIHVWLYHNPLHIVSSKSYIVLTWIYIHCVIVYIYTIWYVPTLCILCSVSVYRCVDKSSKCFLWHYILNLFSVKVSSMLCQPISYWLFYSSSTTPQLTQNHPFFIHFSSHFHPYISYPIKRYPSSHII